MSMSKKQVCTVLGLDPEHVKFSKGKFTYFRSFYYGASSGREKEMEKSVLAAAEREKDKVSLKNVESGVHWHAFVGSAPAGSARDSFHFVSFEAEAVQ